MIRHLLVVKTTGVKILNDQKDYRKSIMSISICGLFMVRGSRVFRLFWFSYSPTVRYRCIALVGTEILTGSSESKLLVAA
jgi:hypothetical protein